MTMVVPFHYSGDRVPGTGGGANVTVLDVPRGRVTPLPPRNDVWNHSPDGFQWGYGGSGPAQLALALCVHALDGDVWRALRVYQQFKSEVIAKLDTDSWSMDQMDVLLAIQRIEQAQKEERA